MRRAWHQNFKRTAKSARTFGGVVFDSAAEGKRWLELVALEKAGVISHLQRQITHVLLCGNTPIKYASGRQATYTPDFEYMQDGNIVYEEHKGFDDDTSKLRRAVFSAMIGQPVLVTGAAAKKSIKKSKKPS